MASNFVVLPVLQKTVVQLESLRGGGGGRGVVGTVSPLQWDPGAKP